MEKTSGSLDLARDTVSTGVPRRVMLAAPVLAVPAIVAMSSAPAFAVSGTQVTVTVSPSSVKPGGSATVSGQVTPPSGSAAGKSVVLTSSDGNVTFSSSTLTTDSSGKFSATATVAAAASSGTASITATSGGVSTSTVLSYAPEAVTRVTATVSSSSVYTGSSTTVSGRVTGASGNLAGRTVNLTSTDANVTFSNASPTTNSSGTYSASARVAAGSATGSATIKAESGGVTASTTLSYGPVSTVTVSVSPSSVVRGNSVTVSGRVTGGSGSLGGRAVSLARSDSALTYANANPTTDASGNFSTTATVASNAQSGALLITARSGGGTGTVNLNVRSGGSVELDIYIQDLSNSPFTVYVSGLVTSTSGTPLSGRTVTFTASDGSSIPSTTTGSNGRYGVNSYPSRKASPVTYTASCDGVTVSTSFTRSLT